jgi:iron complex outermembrane receptor protein
MSSHEKRPDVDGRAKKLPGRQRTAAPGSTAGSAGLVALSLVAGSAIAQSAGPSPAASAPPADQLQEVVVTAQFRTENIQQAPLAISAVTASALAERGQTSITQITSDVPSVQLAPNTSAFGPSMSAYIRGIGQGDNDPALEPGVGIYIDDVYFGTNVGSVLDLLDLDRVEVLRGPQGTLEGMNSEGGAIKLFSKAPDGTASTNFDALYGSRNHVELRASTDFALTDNLFVRVSGVGNHQDGYEKIYDFGCANPTINGTAYTAINPVTGAPTNPVAATYTVSTGFTQKINSCQIGSEGGIGYTGGRVALRWVINDRLDATLSGDITNQDQENPAETLLKAQTPLLRNPVTGQVVGPNTNNSVFYIPATNVATGASAYLPYNSALVPAIVPSNPYNTYTTLCMPALQAGPGPFGPLPAVAAECGQNRTQLQSWGTQLVVNWSINDNLSLKNIISDRGYSSQWYEDNDASPWPLGLGADGIDHHQFSEEMRLNGSVAHFLDWTLGGYYFSEKSVYASHQNLAYAVAPGALDFLQDDPITAHDKAGYLHTVWHLTSKLDVTAGVRYTKQDKDYHYVRVAPEAALGSIANVGCPAAPTCLTNSAFLVESLNGYVGRYAASRVDYRGDLAYHLTDQLLGYAQVSTGFKGGGVDPRPFYVPQAISFKPETLTNYELGLKSSWLDNRLRVNVDGYFSQYDNIQLTLLNCSGIPSIAAATAAAQAAGIHINFGSPCALPYNAGDAHEYGLELESQLRLGGFQADVSASYLHFEYTNLFFSPATVGVTPGMVTPFTPRVSGNAGVQYTFVLPKGSVTARADGTARSEIWTNAVNSPLNRIGGYTLYNAHMLWESPKGDWQVGLHALNLTNKLYYLNVFDLSSAGGGSTTGSPAPPRELDIEIKHKL